MTVRAAIATGNFTTATTWGVVDATSYLNSEAASSQISNASWQATSAFTPGAIEVHGLCIKTASRLGTTGTLSVRLELDSDNSAVAGTTVTINVADVATGADTGWLYFKFSSPVTLSAATAYQLAITVSDSSQISIYRDSTSNNWSRCLVTTTTGAPAAGDDLIICGHKTAAGAETAIEVTMNETATTDYGSASTATATPALAICDGGSLTYGTTASTNYNLRLSGCCIVYSGGTLNIGTTGTAIPRNSTATLQFDCAADGDFGLIIRSLGTFNAQGLSRTTGKNVSWCLLNTDEAANSTSLGVDTDTGWLDNDVIAVGSTTRTAAQCEKGTMNGDAGASSLTVDGFAGTGGGVAYAHGGTSPVVGEVILLTRNVVIESVSTSAMAYVYATGAATVDCDWVEFRYLGANASTKYGIQLTSITSTATFNFCSIHDGERYGFYLSGSASTGVTISYCTFWSTGAGGSSIHIQEATSGTWTISYNVVIYCTATSTPAVYLADVGGTFAYNRIVGAISYGIHIAETGGIGTISNCNIHSGSNFGLYCLVAANVTFTGCTVWRNSSSAVAAYGGEWSIVSCLMFGNTTTNLILSSGIVALIDSTTICADSSFAVTNNVMLYAATAAFKSCLLSDATGIYVAATNDFNFTNSSSHAVVKCTNTKLGASNEVTNASKMTTESYIGSSKHDQTKGLHKGWLAVGTWIIDTVIYDTTPSLRMTPSSAATKLEMVVLRVAVADGATCTPSIKIRESVAGDGTDYNGNRPRLILKRNDAAGITADAVLDTATVSAEGAFETLTGTTAAVTDDCVLEFAIDCDGITGWVNVDTASAA
jgi:hypothetical protein